MNPATLVKTYWNISKTKRAEIHKDPDDGLSVRVYDSNGLTEVKELHNFSIHAAENIAEHSVKEGNERLLLG